MASVLLSACARDGHVPEDVDVDRLCGVVAAAFNDRDAALLSEVARRFRVERSRLRLDADGVYVPQSRFFVEERGIYVARPGAVLPKASDPSFTPVRLCVYRYRIAGQRESALVRSVMRDLSEIGLDTNCLTYLLSALEGVAAPTDGLAEQKVALVRLYLYTPGTLWVTPTVKREFLRIRDEVRRASHVSWTSVLFGVRPLNDAAIERRAASLEPFHTDLDDRLVLAESEDIGFATLVSFDAKFVNHLSNHARLLLTEPAALWASLSIPRGATPDKVPAFSNPLASEIWWRW